MAGRMPFSESNVANGMVQGCSKTAGRNHDYRQSHQGRFKKYPARKSFVSQWLDFDRTQSLNLAGLNSACLLLGSWNPSQSHTRLRFSGLRSMRIARPPSAAIDTAGQRLLFPFEVPIPVPVGRANGVRRFWQVPPSTARDSRVSASPRFPVRPRYAPGFRAASGNFEFSGSCRYCSDFAKQARK
jgi:hypothetical protein